MFISFIYQKIVGGLRGVAMERKSLNIVKKHVFICSYPYTVKKSPDWNRISPCIPAGFGFLSTGWLSKSIWKLIRIYLGLGKNDYYIFCFAYHNVIIRLKIPNIFHLYKEPFPYNFGNS